MLFAATPASAGDVAAPNGSVVGDWRTSTNGVKQTITFDAKGRVFGDSGCNRFTGGYTVKGDSITIGPLASTLMACPDRQMAAEATFLTRLQAAVSFTATKATLKVYSPKDMIRFRAVS
ncbi:MAG: META domain-containing protein [Actinobacteria bacterium]|nr:META domain-containing protein [Actinomycetota bacterium]